MKIEIELPEHFITNLENRLAAKLNQILEDRVKLLQERSVKHTRVEAAQKLRITLPTLDKRINEGSLKAQKIGKRIFIDSSEIEKFSYHKRP